VNSVLILQFILYLFILLPFQVFFFFLSLPFDLINMVYALQWSNSLLGSFGETNHSELAAFTSYALAFPRSFLALVDTYDVSVVFASRLICFNSLE
jgi:hypothetical protein